jgi:hypothetical protein
VSLWTLLGGFIPVAVLFVAVTQLRFRRLARAALAGDLLEALAATLLGALWFGSLGSGGWWLVFFLIGVLAGLAERGTRIAFLRSAFRAESAGFFVALGRYLAAGAILAWRLG